MKRLLYLLTTLLLIAAGCTNGINEQGDIKKAAAVLIQDMIHVKGGTFEMGATSEQSEFALQIEKPVHQVTVSDFYISRYEVSQALWQTVMQYNPSAENGAELPVHNVTWDECQVFIERLNTYSGKSFRLPTEAEWEYAARGGKNQIPSIYAGGNDLSTVGWYSYNSSDGKFGTPKKIGTKTPNELGIYDMSGNVREWCSDWVGQYTADPISNPIGPITGIYRSCRGGSWMRLANLCRNSYRGDEISNKSAHDIGFRLVYIP